MLLSKRSEMFLPDQWPAYFSRAKGCEVWDLDGNAYLDLSLMGVGTNTLGYGHSDVDEAVSRAIRDGNMSTLNCPEELALAEKLISLHPWASMARFARTGGEANAVAIRIARAFSGRDQVAVCGYHGWHDWYLAANISSDSELDGHLLPGLEPRGVPRNLAETVLTFEYNRIDQLADLIKKHDIGVIKMEVQRGDGPADGFLREVRSLADKHGIILIFDECTSGFRETFGGLHSKYGVDPDMAVFGKALGNGYAITAVLGRREIMQAAQSTFISSTFWTERIGPSAALKTLEVMEETESWKKITAIGSEVKSRWSEMADKYGLPLKITGLDALASFTFEDTENHLLFKSFITQQMLREGFLATTTLYASIADTPTILERYFATLGEVFAKISSLGPNGVLEELDGPVAHSGFRRLN